MSARRKRRAMARLEGHIRQGKPGQTWYRIENLVQAPGTACIYLYGEVGMWGVTAEDFVSELQQINATQVDLHINSMGGDVFEGIAILNSLRSHRATVTTYVDGLAASIASVIAMAGERVIMGRNTSMMVHEASAIEIGNADAMQAMANLLGSTSDNIASIYAEKAGGDVAQWREIMRAETWYSAEEAVAAGLADEVDGGTAADDTASTVDELMTASFDLSVFTYPGRDNAPTPKPVAELAAAEESAAEPVAPVTDPSVEPLVPAEPVAEVVEPPATVEDQAEPEAAADEPPAVAEPEPPAPLTLGDTPTDEWSALTRGLLTPDPAASTVDELFAALLQKGTPA